MCSFLQNHWKREVLFLRVYVRIDASERGECQTSFDGNRLEMKPSSAVQTPERARPPPVASASRCAASRTPTWTCLQPKHSQRLQPVVPVRPVLPSHSALWNTCLCPSVPSVCFFFPPPPPPLGMLPLLIHKDSHPDPKARSSLLGDFKSRLFCIHKLGDQLSSAVPPPPPPHSPPKHRAESRPQVISFPLSHPTTAREQQRLKRV